MSLSFSTSCTPLGDSSVDFLLYVVPLVWLLLVTFGYEISLSAKTGKKKLVLANRVLFIKECGACLWYHQ